MGKHQFMKRRAFSLLVLGWAIIITLPVSAADLVVTRYFSGLWDQPKQESQGIILQIIDQEDDAKKAAAYWFTYGDDLNTAWYMGLGEVAGDQVVMTLYTGMGVGFMEEDLPGNASIFAVGSMTLTFRNCNFGTASYETGEENLGNGEFEIKKLAGLYHSRCSGGISDDTPSNAKPVQLEVMLEPARENISGKGKAKFWERVDRSDFKVSAEDIPNGEYQVQVCGDTVGSLLVAAGEGETEFRSPEAEGKELLYFKPRGCLIELHDGGGAALSSGEDVLAEKDNGNNGGGNGNNGKQEISVELDNTGIMPAAEGKATYEIKNNSVEFEVEIEDVPAGSYPLHVDSVERGQIEVIEDDGKFKGKLKFSDPQKEGKVLLDFNPRGEIVEVYSGVDIILEIIPFPDE